MTHESSEKTQGKESVTEYEVFELGEGRKSISFGLGTARLTQIDKAIAEVFPGVAREDFTVSGTDDGELIISRRTN